MPSWALLAARGVLFVNLYPRMVSAVCRLVTWCVICRVPGVSFAFFVVTIRGCSGNFVTLYIVLVSVILP